MATIEEPPENKYNPLSMENYKLISDWAKYTNARYDTHLKTLLTLHGLILAGISFLFKEGNNDFDVLRFVVPIAGILICFLGHSAIKRILLTCNLRSYQARKFEKQFSSNTTKESPVEELKLFTTSLSHLTENQYKEIIKNKGLGITQRLFAFWVNFIFGVVYLIFFFVALYKISPYLFSIFLLIVIIFLRSSTFRIFVFEIFRNLYNLFL